MQRQYDGRYEKTAELLPWSQVGPVRYSFAGYVESPRRWLLTVHIDEPGFRESRHIDGLLATALLDFGMACLERSEAARRR